VIAFSRIRALGGKPFTRLAPLAVIGPAFAVSIGYIDPGNWATDLAAGAYGTLLLWSVVLASLMAVILQLLCVHHAVSTGVDLATSIAERWPRTKTAAWLIFQGAAAMTDAAELTGVTIGLHLLFGLAPLPAIGIAAVMVLGVTSLGAQFERAMLAVLGIVALSYVYELVRSGVDVAGMANGLFPRIPDAAALLLIVGIVGATVMPHNLFLHTALVSRGLAGRPPAERLRRAKLYALETWIALGIAGLVNAAILLVAARIHGAVSIEAAYATVGPAFGAAAATVFGAALLAAGLGAAGTATAAGDVVAAALGPASLNRTARRLLTLSPGVIVLALGVDATHILIWSQVVLALLLPLAILPLVVVNRGAHAPGRALGVAARITAFLCLAFDLALLVTSLV